MERVIVQPVAYIVKLVLMLQLVQLVFHHTLKQQITNVFVEQDHLLIQVITVLLVPMDVKIVDRLRFVIVVLVHLFFKVIRVKLPAIMASLLLDLLVLDAQLDAYNAHKIYNATIVLMDSSCIMENVSLSALLVLSVIKLEVIGIVFLAIHHARPVSTTPHTVLVVSMEWDIFKPQPSNNIVS